VSAFHQPRLRRESFVEQDLDRERPTKVGVSGSDQLKSIGAKAGVQAMIRSLTFPIIGRLGRVSGTRELVIPETKYIVAYRIVDEVIHILAILHGAQRWPRHFKSLGA
jgi:addiction module RelE/StbE family toxin